METEPEPGPGPVTEVEMEKDMRRTNIRESRTSEESNPCAICLGPIIQESFLDKCFHKFCYNCIMQWTKVVSGKHSLKLASVKCPLCKIHFLIHVFLYSALSYQKLTSTDYSVITPNQVFDSTHPCVKLLEITQVSSSKPLAPYLVEKEIQTLMQEEDVGIVVHHICGVIDSFQTKSKQQPKRNKPEAKSEEFRSLISDAARPFLAARTDLFVSEVELFLASGLNIEAYDAVYKQRLVIDMATDSDNGAFMEKIILQPASSDIQLPLHALTFAVKDIFDIDGFVTGFGNPDWARTHSPATSTAPAVLAILRAGAKCVGKTVMDEMAYSINGENKHYGTPRNPSAPDRVPGGSSSGSAVAVGAGLVDFSLGTDTGGSVRVPASYCGIFGFRPSHDIISTSGVIPMAQSFDTVGWFARDHELLNRVGRVLLQLPQVDPIRPSQLIIAEDCFQLSTTPGNLIVEGLAKSVEKLFGAVRVANIVRETIGHLLKYANLGNYVMENVPSLKSFVSKVNVEEQEYNIPSLAALSSAMRLLQRYEFKSNHGEWVKAVKPDLGPGISERVCEALEATDENIDACLSVKTEIRAALTELLGDFGVLAIPTLPGPPPKLQTPASTLEVFRARAFSLLSIAGVSGLCQVSIPLGKYDSLLCQFPYW
ncbi:hypothetical protein G4B88_000623 [Cannabis sativa]|uniref:RING-type domain-containing protein n=1 Tax=Cannabis sativa TaxID=3483 RepID=A0A7J6ES86_CANSA|nr:hypothetical protein G4B88_000623 [Cannabis sativa]